MIIVGLDHSGPVKLDSVRLCDDAPKARTSLQRNLCVRGRAEAIFAAELYIPMYIW